MTRSQGRQFVGDGELPLDIGQVLLKEEAERRESNVRAATTFQNLRECERAIPKWPRVQVENHVRLSASASSHRGCGSKHWTR